MKINRQVFKYKKQILLKKVVIKPPFREEKFFHNEGCFVYMKEYGSILHSSEDTLKLAPKEAVLLKCDNYFMDFVQEFDNQTIEIIAIHLYPNILKEIFISDLPSLIEKQLNNPETKHIVDDLIIRKFIESLEFYFDNPSLVNESILELKIKELILILIQTKNINSIIELIRDLYTNKTVSLKDIVNKHLYSNFTTKELAKLCQMSLASFKRQFKKEFNVPPTIFFTNQKLLKAKELLSFTDLPIREIAYEVGFNDPQYFAQFFKKKVGCLPRKFRANLV